MWITRLLLSVCLQIPGQLQDEAGSISGVVLDGSNQRLPVAGAGVVLRVKLNDEFVVAAETTTDAAGHFRFHPLPLRDDFQYVPGANRNEVHYPGPRVRLTRDKRDASVELVVYDVIREPSPLVARKHDFAIVVERGLLRVTETLLVDNPTTKCYVGQPPAQDAEPITLRLAIPSNFERTTFHKEFFGRRFSLLGGAVVTSIPWEPGVRELKYTYVLPNTKQDWVWERPLDLPCSEVRVSVQSEEPDAVSCNLEAAAAAQGEAIVFRSTGQTLPAGHTIRVELGRLPIPWMSYGRWLAIGALLALVVGASLVAVRRRGTPTAPNSRQGEGDNEHQDGNRPQRPQDPKTSFRRAA